MDATRSIKSTNEHSMGHLAKRNCRARLHIYLYRRAVPSQRMINFMKARVVCIVAGARP